MEKMKIGIVAAPEFPTELANNLIDELPQQLNYQFKEDLDWEIEIETDAFLGVAEEMDTLIDASQKYKEENNWSYTFCFTDLPDFIKERTVRLAHTNASKNITVLSIPAFGWAPRKQMRKLVSQVALNIYHETSNTRKNKIKENRKKLALFPKIRKEENRKNNDVELDYLFQSKWLGRLIVLLGMAYANSPWQLITSLNSILPIAFSAGAYGLIFPTLWMLSDAFSLFRLIAFTVVSISIMCLWIIQGHGLWEKSTLRNDKMTSNLYNTSTIMTLGTGVLFFYIILFLLFFITSFVIVPPDLYSSEVGLSHSPNIIHYLQLGWLTASVGTITGAIGAGFEDTEKVRDIAYGYRQNKRYQEIEAEKEEEKRRKKKVSRIHSNPKHM